jgi:geranylgeranylglycerol-phosphate geranylgeranyltransferase
MTRPVNGLMAGLSVMLGFWLAQAPRSLMALVLLVVAAFASVSFGNVVNDLHDIATDRISHPERPLATGAIRPAQAWLFALLLTALALLCGFAASVAHGVGTLIPIALLALYARFLKGTPLTGNILVSLLVGYALLFGALRAPLFAQLLAPAGCAFLLNFCREIVKDLQDEAGDRQAGIVTSAALSPALLRGLIAGLGVLYLVLLPVPYLSGAFHAVYLGIALALIPLHVVWTARLFRPDWRDRLGRVSGLIKLEMLGGLIALAADRLA